MNNSSKNNAKSTYKTDVIANNKAYKNACRSVNKGLKLLKYALDGEVASKPMVRQIDKILKDDALYQQLHKNVRRITKGANKGKTCPFYILQAVHKMKEGKSLAPKNTNAPKQTTEPKTNLKPIVEVKVKDLKEKAKAKGVKGYSKMKKDELVEALKAA